MMEVSQAYSILERSVIYGFVTVKVTVGHEFIVFKSIGEREMGMLDILLDGSDSYTEFLYKLSFSTLFVNHENCLDDRFGRLPNLMEFYSGMPGVTIGKVKAAIQKMNEEYTEALRSLEGFCYTDRSKYLWKVLGDRPRIDLVGLKGIEVVGMNAAQENWIIINKRLDEEEQYHKDFGFAILVASSMNPKGSKTISKQAETSRMELQELRDEIALYGYDKKRQEEERKKAVWTAPVKSREDLVGELYRQMTGQKDKHDLFIEEWIKQQRDKAEEAKRKVEERQNEYHKAIESIDFTKMEESRPVSLEDIRKIQNAQPGAQTAMSAYENVGSGDRIMKKMSSRVIRAEQ